MSNVWEYLNFEKSKDRIIVDTSHPLQYITKPGVSEKVIFTVTLPYECLREWHDARKNVLDKQVQCSYVEILNAFLCEKTGMKVKEGCERVEGRLRRACGKIRTKLRGKNGSSHKKLCQTVLKMTLQLEDMQTLLQVECDLNEQKSVVAKLQEDKQVLTENCERLLEETVKSQSAEKIASMKLSNADSEIKELREENQNLNQYVEKLGQQLDFPNNSGKLKEIGDRQQRRKLKELKTKVEKALWFAETFGLQLDSVKLTDENGACRRLSYSEKVKASYKELPEADQHKVKSVLFILDKFCISDASYHELTMVCGNDELPRSYLIKQCKDDLNKMCHVTRTPGSAHGAQLDFKTELETVVQNMIHQNVISITDHGFKLHLKLSGDGAKMSRLTNFVVISFSILNNQEDAMSSKGNHTVAIIKGQESYQLLQSSCSAIFQQINDLIKNKKIVINGTNIPVEVYLGGDYKFLLLVLGMKSATSDYACAWCKIHKKDRYDVSKDKDFYWNDLARSIDGIKECAKRGKFSCAYKPLLDIPLCNVVLDELHLMLRVTDKLTKNLVTNAVESDRKENVNKRPMDRTSRNVQNLIKTICSCGVTFNVWEKMDADGKGSGIHDFTSLMGPDKKLLLKNLPMKLSGILPADTSDTIVKLWQVFNEIYNLMRTKSPTDQQTTEYFTKAVSWVNMFISLRGKRLGYEKARVTPYMHAMVYHVPRFMCMHEGLKKFTGQGVEKLNDDCRRVHLRRSNKWDAPTDVLLVGKRVEHLSQCERASRTYQKQNSDYWENGIKESRAKRHRISAEIVETVNEDDDNIDTLTADEIRQKLRDVGIKTRYRCVKKLKELLINHSKDKENQPQNI